MNRNKALNLYLLGTIGQILIVVLVVCFMRYCGLTVDYTSAVGIAAITIGGISSALWGTIVSIKYRKISFKSIICDFFRIKQSYKNYLLTLLFLFLDFVPVMFGGRIGISAWYLLIVMFAKHIVFGGIEEIGWRYFFQSVLQERRGYVLATILTFLAWGVWHFLYFFIEGTLSDVNVFPFLLGLLMNCFILSALFSRTKNLWLCVMTHSLINVFSQVLVEGNAPIYLSYVCKGLVVSLAILVVLRTERQRVPQEAIHLRGNTENN